jgi:hypothetical protein
MTFAAFFNNRQKKQFYKFALPFFVAFAKKITNFKKIAFSY